MSPATPVFLIGSSYIVSSKGRTVTKINNDWIQNKDANSNPQAQQPESAHVGPLNKQLPANAPSAMPTALT